MAFPPKGRPRLKWYSPYPNTQEHFRHLFEKRRMALSGQAEAKGFHDLDHPAGSFPATAAR
jgi:hypothetical protein